MSSVGVVILLAVFFLALAGIGIGVLHYMREMKQQHDRLEKQRLADQLNAQADTLRHNPPPAGAAQPVLDAGAAAHPSAPIVTHPDVAPAAAVSGPCPLGANLVEGKSRFCIDLYEYPGGKTIPRTNIRFEEAGRLCSLRGERLCTEGEWERACRGKGGASYPYGATYDVSRCNTRGGEIEPAGNFKDCRSGSGAYDMSGNVAEWVSAKGQPAQKGGSAQQGNPLARCSYTVRGGGDGALFTGFRCCADPAK